MRYGIGNHQRLRKPAEFRRVYDGRVRAGDDRLLVFGLPNDSSVTRFGLSVSRKHGNSVTRSQIKRRLREGFRLTQHELPVGWDLILIPRQGVIANTAEYAKSIRKLAAKLPRKI
ncbi:ribonuclease P protein component [Stratiformator vulcanicus]|uniref:Ribonuclease P protein component n=1 Tax=Stratiformator vulcanicus TaxID=2527980 RepID=A0A517QYS7_9PLAN|nr:ribonuclease P protein component [Stratiformator vulcanicus]QDT36806.1 Ribonuclease P protein component [Stratiformator vulcanicus]